MERFEYTLETDTTEPPASKSIRADNADLAATTKLWVHYLTSGDEDVARLLLLLDVGDVVYLQDFDNHANGAAYLLTGPAVDRSGYVELAVGVVASAGAIVNRARVMLATATAAEGSTPPSGDTYIDVDELFRVLKINNPSLAQIEAGERVLLAAAGEIDAELGRTTDLAGWELALAGEVNLDRAVEHWQQSYAPFGIVGLAEAVPTMTARDTWERHANKLAPLKQSWGLA